LRVKDQRMMMNFIIHSFSSSDDEDAEETVSEKYQENHKINIIL